MKKIIDKITFLTQKNVNEEATKNYLIYPFFELLGYDMSSPLDTVYEYVCDMHEKGNRRVDFALKKGNLIHIIVEAKTLNTNLYDHIGQLKTYFISSNANYAILTNGRHLLIFDRDQINSFFVNEAPKYTVDLLQLNESDYVIFEMLRKNEDNDSLILENNEILPLEPVELESEEESDVFSNTPKIDAFELIKNMLDKQDVAGKKVVTVYNTLLEKLNEYEVKNITLNKFVSLCKMNLKVKIITSFGDKYFVDELTQTDIFKRFVNQYPVSYYYGKPCENIYNDYVKYCQSTNLIYLSKKRFNEMMIGEFEDLSLATLNKKGVYINYFVETKSKIDVQKKEGQKTDDSKVVQNNSSIFSFVNSVGLDSIIGKVNSEVYEMYESYCLKNQYQLESISMFSRTLRSEYNVVAAVRHLKDKSRRIYMLDKRSKNPNK